MEICEEYGFLVVFASSLLNETTVFVFFLHDSALCMTLH